ncbi:MAG: GNAT family N-acetyltransferase [Candidatus Limnocylindria bacterium]
MSRQPTVRRARPQDSAAAFDVFLAAIVDLTTRQGTPWQPDGETVRERLLPLYLRLGDHAAEWWVAEDADGGEIIGYARSVERGGLFELTEFFVRPGSQSAGVGRELMVRAFPPERGQVRAIVATTDVRAQARYYAAGTVARFPIAALSGAPRAEAAAELGLDAAPATGADLPILDRLEAAVLEFPRGDEFLWLLEEREGWLFRREGTPVGFGFVGRAGSGPVAALDPDDQVPILRHLEARAAALAVAEWSLEVPMINEVAMRHLLGRGFRMDPFLTLLMSSRPFGQFDRFIGFAPPFIL